LSLSYWKSDRPVPVDRWSATIRRKIEATRDKIMFGVGTSEEWIEETLPPGMTTRAVITTTFRKPLRIEEVNQMTPTPEVRERKGRA